MPEIDLFQFFRRGLAVLCGVYTILQAIRVIVHWFGPLDPRRPHQRRLRNIILTQVLRTSFRRFSWDILQIVALFALLMAIVNLHY